MHYDLPAPAGTGRQAGEVGVKDALKKYLKEAGEESVKPIDKLTIKRKDLEGKEGETIVLSAS